MIVISLKYIIDYVKSLIDRNYTEKNYHQWKTSRDKKLASWQVFGDAIIQIPKHGWTVQQCKTLIDDYARAVNNKVIGKFFSGSIYASVYQSSTDIAIQQYPSTCSMDTTNLVDDELDTNNRNRVLSFNDVNSGLVLESNQSSLLEIQTHVFKNFCYANSLHDEFDVGGFSEYQTVRMVAGMYTQKPECLDAIAGTVTTGGTQSLMNAVRCYQNFGMDVLGLKGHECVILVTQLVHTSLEKAGQCYGCSIRVIPSIPCGNTNPELVKQLKREISMYSNPVAIFCSAPNYPLGIIDDVRVYGEIARERQIGLHVDCCLGGFIVPFNTSINQIDRCFLDIPGTTSMSVDTHKNGRCIKGSSVFLCGELRNRNVMYWSIYTFPDADIGVYGTVKDEGSQSIVAALCSQMVLLHTGMNEYRLIAEYIMGFISQCRFYITDFVSGKDLGVEIFGEICNTANVLAFKFNGQKYCKGATHYFADLMVPHGFILSHLPNDVVHVCVTERWVTTPGCLQNFLESFQKCYQETLKKLQENPDDIVHLSKNARMYGQISTAMSPKFSELGIIEYAKNYFFGKQGARDAVRMHFLAQLNPNKFQFEGADDILMNQSQK